jgi:hypothetical protein
MPNRVKANSITIKVNSVLYTADLSDIMMQSEEASNDVSTFADAQVGGSRDWYIEMGGVTSTDATGFFMTCWNAAGTEVPFELATTAATIGKFTGTVRIPAKGAIPFGGSASADGSFSWSGVRFDIVGTPTWVPAVA